MKQNTSKRKRSFFNRVDYVFSAIIVLAFILRVWNAPEFFSFNFDEEYQATLAASIVKDFHIIWIGVSASNVGYYLGPGFTYLNALLFWFTKGDPVILSYFSPILGVITCASIFYVARELFSKKAAYFASLFYATSTLVNYFDRRFWNPTPIMFISLWMLYALVKTYENPIWIILVFALIAASLHIHLSLTLFWIVIFFVAIQNRKKITFKIWTASIGVFMVLTLPMLVFDFVHNFDNLRAPFVFLTHINRAEAPLGTQTMVTHIKAFLATISRIWYLKPYTNIQEEHGLGAHGEMMTKGILILSLFTLMTLGYLVTLWKKGISYRILALSLFVLIAGFIFYPGVAGEYYLLSVIALTAIAVGIFFEKLPFILTLTLCTIMLIVNSITIFTTTQKPYGLLIRKKLIQRITKIVGNEAFSVETYGRDPRKYHPYGGWRYLFTVYGKKPAQSSADEFFGWIYPAEIGSGKPTLKVIIFEDIDRPPKVPAVARIKEGAYTAYITQNP